MLKKRWLLTILLVALSSILATAQAPAGSTGQCNDGTYTSAAHKTGACHGHQGVKTWFAESSTAGAATSSKTSTGSSTSAQPSSGTATSSTSGNGSSMAATSPKEASSSTTSKAAAPGGGPNLVWVNTGSNVYHCYGSSWYGKTKNGKYMSEADAKAAGARPDHNKPCSK